MDITFNCDKCGQNIVADEASVGRAIQCPKCRQAIVVPSPMLLFLTSTAKDALRGPQTILPTASELEREQLLWKEIGKTLLFLQQTEQGLKAYIFFVAPPKGNRAAAVTILDEIWGKPLGALLNKLRKSVKVPDDFDARLEAFKDERNWLAHKIGVENHDDIHDELKFGALLQRLYNLKTEAGAISEMFATLCERWLIANGHTTKDKLEAETVRRFNQGKSGVT